MSLDYFQGLLVQVGVAEAALPVDGRPLTPEQALALVPELLSTPVTLSNFAGRRMAAHLLLEVATGGLPVARDALHARMRRFNELLVVRPDGYLVRPTTGEALQKAGEVVLGADGTLRAGGFEVGGMYRARGEGLFPVDAQMQVPEGAVAAGPWAPDDGVMLPAAEGAVLAVADALEGLFQLALHPLDTLEGIARLPKAARELYAVAPAQWEAFRHKPYAERVRTLSRLTTGALIVVGTSGAGGVRAASWGGKLGQVSVPLLAFSRDGALALRLVAVPVGGAVAAAGSALSTTYVLHMAASGAGGGGGPRRLVQRGNWVDVKESMSEASRRYQAQVTGAPRGQAFRVTLHEGDKLIVEVDFDGFRPHEGPRGLLLEAKNRYAHFFDGKTRDPEAFFAEGAQGLISQAERQVLAAQRIPIRWIVAQPEMVPILRKLFDRPKLRSIEIVHIPPLAP